MQRCLRVNPESQMNPHGAFLFLVYYAFDLYIFIVLTRFLLQLVRADFYNPLSQFVVRATNPVLMPLRRMFPSSGTVDSAALVMVVLLLIAKIVAIQLLGAGAIRLAPLPMLVYLVSELARLLLGYVFWAVLARVILSWVAPDPYNPVVRIVVQLTEPVMAPARRLLPPMGGLDLSPILVLLAIQFLRILFGL